ncbi:Putative DNA-binding domain-containing protein [Mariprofundus ferrinatatus]|uniref:DNA-binding domain-containing protein n=1 Tax=Mariprofundus ferrinatatus TaxID=1921087 RepID=A0A2K8LBD7_9PROT|nr:ATP-binding protein [Mariprofundus ferrinatatus]ATX81556.1 Putative DNA-binding domain-containing protein [Mariprofundus ferrinatatus]
MPHKELYERINLELIQEWISEQKEETVHLDFKCVEQSSMGRADRKNLAKALSGFANSEGGIVVWGVDARANEDGIDCAQGIVDIDNVARFVSKLNEFTSEVSPSINGVLHKRVPTDGERGLAVTIVPESDSGPHMAKASLDQYFKRSGDKFLKMEHFEVADMFGKRKQAKLRLLVLPGLRDEHSSKLFLLRLINIGRGSAIAPSLRIMSDPPCISRSTYGIDGNCNRGLVSVITALAGNLVYGGNTNDVIHPGSHLDVDHIRIGAALIEEIEQGNRDITLHAYLSAVDSPSTHDQFQVSAIIGGTCDAESSSIFIPR